MRFFPLLVVTAILAVWTETPAQAGVSVYSEFSRFEETARALPLLKAKGAGLIRAVTPEDLEDDALWALWQEAERMGVEFRPWLLLPEADGYWLNKWNAGKMMVFLDELLAAARARGVRPAWITLDLEQRPELLREISASLKRGKLVHLVKRLRRESRELPMDGARELLKGRLDALHAAGVRVHAVTTPLVLHSPGGGDAVESALGLPLSGLPWDQVSFMVYRPEFQKFMGPGTGAGLVRLYARRAIRRFGERAALDLGEIGSISFPEPTHGFQDPRELEEDVRAARAEGITQLQFYSLEGMLQSPAPGRWLEPAGEAAPRGVSLGEKAFFRALDLLARLL